MTTSLKAAATVAKRAARVDRVTRETSISVEVNLDGLRAGMGVTPDVAGLTYRDLQARRQIIRKRMRERRRRRA